MRKNEQLKMDSRLLLKAYHIVDELVYQQVRDARQIYLLVSLLSGITGSCTTFFLPSSLFCDLAHRGTRSDASHTLSSKDVVRPNGVFRCG